MRIAVVQASSQASKNNLLFEITKKYAKDSEVYNFGCFAHEEERYSYIEIALLIGMLIDENRVDFVVTGCSSGQGMMLACNSMPGVLCGYVPSPRDAFLFAQINNGNAVSLPLGEEYTYAGKDNLEETVRALFSKPFGGGWPESEAERKVADSIKLKEMRTASQLSFKDFLGKMMQTDMKTVEKIRKRFDLLTRDIESHSR